MRLVYLRWDWSVPHETALCHMRFLCPTLDCSSPYETGLSQMRLVCPTWDWSVPNETALSNVFCKAQRFLSSFFTFLGLIWHFRDWSMGRDWDRTGTELEQDWSIRRDGTGTNWGLSIIKEQAKRNFTFLVPIVLLGTEVWDGTGTGLGRYWDWDGTGTGLGWDWSMGRMQEWVL